MAVVVRTTGSQGAHSYIGTRNGGEKKTTRFSGSLAVAMVICVGMEVVMVGVGVCVGGWGLG